MNNHVCVHPPIPVSYYTQAVQTISQYLHKKGWKITHLIFASIFGEPRLTLFNAIAQGSDWKTAWKKTGFHDVGNAEGFKHLEAALKTSSYAPPVILLHPVYSSPAIWTPWMPVLAQAQKDKKIGHVITLQLSNDITQEDKLVRETITKVAELYAKAFPQQQTLMNLVGASRGGYVAHLASFESDHIHDDQNIERRWHSEERNPLVGTVVTLSSPTWLCMEGFKDPYDIYPEKEFSKEQIQHIHKSHPHIYDIIATEDAISPTYSPLPKTQVYEVQHGHQGIICPEVCNLAIALLQK